MGKRKRKSLLLQTMYFTSFFFFSCLSIVLLFIWPSINGWYWLRRILRQACQQWQYTIVGPYYTLNTWIKWFSFGKWLLSSSSSSLMSMMYTANWKSCRCCSNLSCDSAKLLAIFNIKRKKRTRMNLEPLLPQIYVHYNTTNMNLFLTFATEILRTNSV